MFEGRFALEILLFLLMNSNDLKSPLIPIYKINCDDMFNFVWALQMKMIFILEILFQYVPPLQNLFFVRYIPQ